MCQLEVELADRPSQEDVDRLQQELRRENSKVKQTWKISCEQLASCDQELTKKDEEIAELKARIARLEAPGVGCHVGLSGVLSSGRDPSGIVHDPSSPSPHDLPSRTASPVQVTASRAKSPAPHYRSGKAPPVDMFTGDSMELHLEDWLPTLERASTWNCWTNKELLIQFAGHLRGKAYQEWILMSSEDKKSYESASRALKARLDPGAKTLAAQDFRHASQRESESVGEFIRRLERIFQISYGGDIMSSETRDTLLLSQLKEGLKFEILKGPAVSGALGSASLQRQKKRGKLSC